MASSLTNPKQRLSHKYVLVTVFITLIGFVILAGLLTAFLNESYEDGMEKSLTRIIDTSHQLVFENISEAKNGFSITNKEIPQGFELLTQTDSEDLTLAFSDKNKVAILASGNESESIKTYGFPLDLKVTESEVEFYGLVTMGQGFEGERYLISRPIFDSKEDTIGYVFAFKSKVPLESFLISFYKIYAITVVAILGLIFTVVTLALDKIMTPLAEIAIITRSFAKGNFSKRVPIYGNGSDELSHLSIAFNNMAAALDTHEQTRKSFVANVSHELKTPMTTISGFIDGILDGTIPKEKEKAYLEIVSIETKRLSRLVVSMLNISKLESGELTIHPHVFDINQIVVQTVFSFEQRITKKNLEVRGLDVKPHMVFADADMVHQVVYNIVDNAIKFANDGGHLEFRYEREKKNILVGIRNSGEGLSDQEISQIFDRFYKVDRSRGLNKEGVGLGLYIVRSIVNLHGGEIIVSSVEGQYTEFVFSLPDESQQHADI